MLVGTTEVALGFQWALWTMAIAIGLVLALCKGMTLLGIVASFAFVALALAPAAVYFGVLSPPPHQILLD